MSARHFVKYTFVRVEPAWRRLPAEERADHKREFAERTIRSQSPRVPTSE